MKSRLSVCLLLLVLSACGSAQSEPPVTAERTPCRVLNVFDGDTLACDLNGNGRVNKPREYIRLLGIDAPETRHSKKGSGEDQPYAREARRFLAKHALGKTVWLEWDIERRDRYDRSLAFVYPEPQGETSLNALLVREGLASTLFIPPNRLHQDRLETLEAQARKQRLGVWNPHP